MRSRPGIFYDNDFLALLQQGDRNAMEQIYFRYADYLFAYALKRVGCSETAADLIQDLFLKIWIRRASINVKGELKAYLTLCLRNQIIDHYSRQKVEDSYLSSLYEEATDQTMELVYYNDTQKALKAGIELLPEKMQQVFTLSKICDHSIDEISSKMNISHQTVKNQLGTAIKRLRLTLGALFSMLLLLNLF